MSITRYLLLHLTGIIASGFSASSFLAKHRLFQYLLPVGPVRIDIACNPDPEEVWAGEEWVFHFSPVIQLPKKICATGQKRSNLIMRGKMFHPNGRERS